VSGGGDTYDTVPREGSASSSPTILKICSRPSSLRRVTVISRGGVALVLWRVDDLRAGAPRPPIRKLSHSRCSCLSVALVRRSTVRRLETVSAASMPGKASFGHKIAVRRYRSVRKPSPIVLGFLDEGAAHRCRAEVRFDLRASILFDA
jgi:hypothetical protein